ncbi:uncharacterized protein EI90DRAFT_3120922 [Cantharellus anzutake]|uniref:uncharacterized protein n=1 Tax=Cantharellus anzutake TaxID=1750568 RepID=UPI0019061148|nr:uncharacterized protein EI90DRAFT_3120922 [Cantharellus anzutake]KAF8335027.1 hypothetical protein EI90DRAFT_3120922 [Cantharellus anzutake]
MRQTIRPTPNTNHESRPLFEPSPQGPMSKWSTEIGAPLSSSSKRHRKQASSGVFSVATLPEYQHTRHRPSTSLSAVWSPTGDYVPPPDYSDAQDVSLAAHDTLASADEADEDSDTPPSRKRILKHMRSRTALARVTTTPDIDSVLERSVQALEMSNVLLQSSLSTHTAFSRALMSDNETEELTEWHNELLSRRREIPRIQGPHGKHVIDDEDIIVEQSSLSQSAHHCTGSSRTCVDTPPHSIGAQIHTNSTRLHHSALRTLHQPSMPSLTIHSPSPTTPAYDLLSSIATRAPTLGVEGRSGRKSRHSPFPPSDVTDHQDLSSRSLHPPSAYLLHVTPRASSQRLRSDSSRPHFPKSSLRAIMSPSFFSKPTKDSTMSFPPLSDGRGAEALRIILQRDVAKVAAAQDKMYRQYERPLSCSPRLEHSRYTSRSPNIMHTARPPSPAGSAEWIVVDPPTPPRSDLTDSNYSAPRIVTSARLSAPTSVPRRGPHPPVIRVSLTSGTDDTEAPGFLAEQWKREHRDVRHEDTDREQVQSDGWLL